MEFFEPQTRLKDPGRRIVEGEITHETPSHRPSCWPLQGVEMSVMSRVAWESEGGLYSEADITGDTRPYIFRKRLGGKDFWKLLRQK